MNRIIVYLHLVMLAMHVGRSTHKYKSLTNYKKIKIMGLADSKQINKSPTSRSQISAKANISN